MKSVSRMTRINELLKREIADLIKKNIEYSNEYIISVTEVDVSPSLRNAKVYISVLGSSDDYAKKEIIRKIDKKRGIIQSQMANHVVLKYTPVLEFKLDKRIEAGDNVLSIIQEIESNESNGQDN